MCDVSNDITHFQLGNTVGAVVSALMHWGIDTVKYFLLISKKISKDGKTFVVDQMFHVLSILALIYIFNYWNVTISSFPVINKICSAFGIDKMAFMRWILMLLILHVPTNILIQNLLMGYKPVENDSGVIVVQNKAGRMIGTIERLIMLMFIAMDQYAAMGLVLTAKSIARYDKITKDEKFAEYYLMGTLLSTAAVVACKMVFL